MNKPIVNSPKILQRIIDNLDSVIMLFDRDLKLNYINPAGEMLFSASERNMVGQKACDLIRCPEAVVGMNLKKALKDTTYLFLPHMLSAYIRLPQKEHIAP